MACGPLARNQLLSDARAGDCPDGQAVLRPMDAVQDTLEGSITFDKYRALIGLLDHVAPSLATRGTSWSDSTSRTTSSQAWLPSARPPRWCRRGPAQLRGRPLVAKQPWRRAEQAALDLTYASDASLRDVQTEHRAARECGDPASGKRGRCPNSLPLTSRPRLARPPCRRGLPVTLLHQTGQAKAQLHRYMPVARLPPGADRPQWGDRDTGAGDGAQLGVSLARARALVAPPSPCRDKLRISEDVWFLRSKIGRLLPQSL